MKVLKIIKGARILCVKSFLLCLLYAGEEVSSLAQSGRPAIEPEKKVQTEITGPVLTVDEVLRQVQENHPKLDSANLEREIAAAKLLEKQGAFDPQISVGSDYLRYNSTSARGKVGTAYQNSAGVEILTRSGMKIFGGNRFNLGNVKSPLSSTGDNGEYYAGVSLPLLRDRGINPKSVAEQQARIETDISNVEFAATRLGLLMNASVSYWDWYAAQKRLEVNRTLFEIAQTRAAQIAERVKSGDLPPIDETEATQEVQRRLGNVVKAERDVQKESFKLALYLWQRTGQTAEPPVTAQTPKDLPEPIMLMPFVVREGVQRALAKRPELENINLIRSSTEIDSRLARNNRKPAVDLYLSPGRDTGDLSVGTTMKMGVTFSLPVWRREADGQLAQTELKLQKITLEQQIIEQQIKTEVNDSASAVNAAYGRYQLAKRELELAQDLERGERSRFELGDSTLFLVNQRERATAEAAVKLIDIRNEYEQSSTIFKVSTVQY